MVCWLEVLSLFISTLVILGQWENDTDNVIYKQKLEKNNNSMEVTGILREGCLWEEFLFAGWLGIYVFLTVF